MKTPRKVYISKNNEYIELTLQEHEALQKTMPGYRDKKFVFLHDCLMEVPESFYTDIYKDKRRQKYLDECAAQYGTISYDMLTTDDFNGKDILIDHNVDIAEEVAESMPYVILVSVKKVAGKYVARYSASSTSKAKFFTLFSFSGIGNFRKLLSID